MPPGLMPKRISGLAPATHLLTGDPGKTLSPVCLKKAIIRQTPATTVWLEAPPSHPLLCFLDFTVGGKKA